MREVIDIYRSALLFSIRNWKLCLLLYFVHLAFSLSVFIPFKQFTTTVLSHSNSAADLSHEFDFNIIMDIFNAHNHLLSGFTLHLIFSLIVYLVWVSYYKGAILAAAKSMDTKLSVFLQGGAASFFRNLRLSVYLIIIYVIVIALMYLYFAKDGLHVFDLDSEDFLVTRFYRLMSLLAVVLFFIGIWSALVRVRIQDSADSLIYNQAVFALKNILKAKTLILALFNLVVVLVLICLHGYLIASDNIESSTLLLLILIQILIYVRMVLILTRYSGFYWLINRADHNTSS